MPRVGPTSMARSNLIRRAGVGGVAAGSVKSRLGFRRGAGAASLSTGIKSRLGPRGSTARPTLGRVTDARQKINFNRIQGGRIAKSTFSDARNKIQANRLLKSNTSAVPAAMSRSDLPLQGTLRSGEPIRNLIITTTNTAAARGNLFQSAVSELGQREWDYGGSYSSPAYTPEPILSRTISNNHYGQLRTAGRSTAAFSPPPGVPGGSTRYSSMRSDYISSSNADYEYMDVDRPAAAARRSLQSRLDAQFKVRVSNLQPTVSVEDVAELFSDVGDLLNAKSLGGGVAEAYYRTRADCLKAVDTYHNRLLDGRPMYVVFDEKSSGGSGRSPVASKLPASSLSLRSASGASSAVKLPKAASSSKKVSPDITAIHKVLFNPSGTSVTNMLFKGAR